MKRKKKEKKKNEITNDEILKLRATMIKLNRQFEKFDKSKQKIILIEFEKKEFFIQSVSRQVKKRIKSEILDSENELRKKTEKKK